MDQNNITDRNVEQLDFTGKHLGNLPRARSLPGSRSDGGMAQVRQDTGSLIDQILTNDRQLRNDLAGAYKEVEKLEANLLTLENEIIELKDTLGSERALREHAEGVIRKIADLIVNGAKDKPT